MEPLFQKILCPIDFSQVSIPALELACKVAMQNDALVYLLYVVTVRDPAAPEDLEQVARKNLHAVARKWLEGKVRHEIVVYTGKPAETVVKAEEGLGVDLVIMATHGRTGPSRARLGSVTEEVVRRSSRPVMTIKPT